MKKGVGFNYWFNLILFFAVCRERPLIELEETERQLGVEQRYGITMSRVREIAEEALHGQLAKQRHLLGRAKTTPRYLSNPLCRKPESGIYFKTGLKLDLNLVLK